ncbi:hypothetical protein ACQ4LE_003842 [Meloidogyne hapla]
MSENIDRENLGYLMEQMSILKDERLKTFIDLLKIIRKNKKDILELFKSQRFFNQLFVFIENNLERIQTEKKNKKSWSEALIELKENGFEGILRSIDICENLNNSVFRSVILSFCEQQVKIKIDNMFESAKIPIKVNLNNSTNENEKIFEEEELENIIFGKKRKFSLFFTKSFLDRIRGSKVLSRASSSSLSSVSSNLSCMSNKDFEI